MSELSMAEVPRRLAYTKCLMVVPIPPAWTPLTYAAAIIPDKYGSSEKLSKLCFWGCEYGCFGVMIAVTYASTQRVLSTNADLVSAIATDYHMNLHAECCKSVPG